MKKYDKDAKCVKCGHGEIEDKYVEEFKPTELCASFGIKSDHEHIERACKNCGYLWKEVPLGTVGIETVLKGLIPVTCSHEELDKIVHVIEDVKIKRTVSDGVVFSAPKLLDLTYASNYRMILEETPQEKQS